MSDENTTKSNHGGRRPGAGRPKQSTVTAVVKNDEVVGKKLRASATQGWEVLADAYPNLMRKAVAEAMAHPEKSTMKMLIELMVKVVGSEPEQKDSVITTLVGNFFDRLSKVDAGSRPNVARNGEAGDVEVDRRHAPGTGADPIVSGVVGSIRVDGVD